MSCFLKFFVGSLLLLSLFGGAAGAFASDVNCVDQETLKGFYEKFSLLEKEKESLRGKLASCSVPDTKNDGLDVTIKQKEGRQLRALESKVAQLMEENGRLKDKLKELGALPEEDLTEESDPADTESKAEPEAVDNPSDEPSLSPILPSEPTSAPESEVKKEGKAEVVPLLPASIETGSGDPGEVTAQEIAEVRPQDDSVAPTSPFEEACRKEYQGLEKKILGRAGNPGEKKTLEELLARYRSLISGSGEGDTENALCPAEEATARLEQSVLALSEAVKGAPSGQGVIQALYHENRRLEATP